MEVSGEMQERATWAAVTPNPARFFVAGGTLGRDAPSYVVRTADAQLTACLQRGDYAYVLDSRQKGKSSLVAHTMADLESVGIQCVKIDLQRIGANLTPDQWYAALVRQFGRQLGIEKEVYECWGELQALGPLSRWVAVLEQVVLPLTQGSIVVFVDEVDFVRALSFSADEFFAAIRECHNRRATDPQFQRLTFCLVGSATPSQLVRNIEVTPFNIGQEVVLTDFTLKEIAPYADALGPLRDGRTLLERVFYWTAGHPYLTQAICVEVSNDSGCIEPSDVDAIVSEMFLTTEARQRQPNLLDISRRILEAKVPGVSAEEARGQMLSAYAQVLAGKKLIVDDSEWRLAALRLSGAVKEEAGTIVPRNRIYARVFDRSWIRANTPDAEVRRQRAAARRAIIRTTTIAAIVFAAIGYLAVRSWTLAGEQSRLKLQAQFDAYGAAMIAATTKWEDSDRSGIQTVLDAHANDPWKGWEWYFWKNRIGGRVLDLKGVREPSIHFSSDPHRLVVRANGFLGRYDVDTLKLIDKIAMPAGAYFMSREFPNGDFLDIQRNGDVIRLDPKTGEIRWEANVGKIDWPNGNLFDSQYRWMVNEFERSLSLTDLATGQPRSLSGRLLRPDFSRDDEPLLCALRA